MGSATVMGSNGTVGNVVVNAGGVLDLNSYNLQLTSLNGSGTVINTGGGSVILNPRAGNTFNFTGNIQGTGLGFVISGASATMTLSGSNTYTGGTTLSAAATMQFGQAASLPGYNTSGKLSVTAGTLVLFTGAAGQPGWTAQQISDLLTYNGANFTGSSFLGINTAASGPNFTYSSNITALGSGVGLTKYGNNTLTLNGNNTYGGATSVNAGSLVLAGSNIYTGITNLNNTAGASTLSIYSIANGGLTPTLSTTGGTNTATVSSAAGLTAGMTVSSANVPPGTTITNIAGTTVTLSASATATASGTASFIGIANALGLSTNAATNLQFANANVLQYLGPAASTDRLFEFNINTSGNGCSIDASGTGPIDFTNTGSPPVTNSGDNAALTLTGTNTGANTMNFVLANNGTHPVSVTKSGAGQWVLANTSTYTGATNVNAGQLTITGALGGTAVTVSGGTLSLQNTAAVSQSTVTFSGGSLAESVANALGGSAALTVSSGIVTLSQANNYSGATTLTGGTLAVANNSAIGGTLTFNGGTIESADSNTRTLANVLNAFTGNATVGGTGDLVLLR